MTDVTADTWWSELYPATAVSRTRLLAGFADLALRQRPSKRGEGRDKSALGNQINGFSVDLAGVTWAKGLLTPSGVRCMQVEKSVPFGDRPEDLAGWAKVVDLYGVFCYPLAEYVVSYYPKLQETRPKKLPEAVMRAVKDQARYTACNALRKSLVTGFSNSVTPVFATLEYATAFIENLAENRPPQSELHESDVFLAFSNAIQSYADKIATADVKPLRGHPDAPGIVRVLTAWADELRAAHAETAGADIPTRSAASARADELLAVVEDILADEKQRMSAIENSAGFDSSSPSKEYAGLTQKARHSELAHHRTRQKLIELISRGQQKTEIDAKRMFLKRRSLSIKFRDEDTEGHDELPDDDRFEHDTVTSEDFSETLGGHGIAGGDSQGTGLAEGVIEFRLDSSFPAGFGIPLSDGRDKAEYAAALRVLRDDEADIAGFCAREWPSYQDTAVATSPDELAEHVREVIVWVAHKRGWRTK